MSLSIKLDDLKGQRTALVIQRSVLKDNIESVERQLGQVAYAINVLEEQEEAATALKEKLAAELEAQADNDSE